MAYRNTFFRWLFLYSLTFGLTYVLKLFTYLCPGAHPYKLGASCREVGEADGIGRVWRGGRGSLY